MQPLLRARSVARILIRNYGPPIGSANVRSHPDRPTQPGSPGAAEPQGIEPAGTLADAGHVVDRAGTRDGRDRRPAAPARGPARNTDRSRWSREDPVGD